MTIAFAKQLGYHSQQKKQTKTNLSTCQENNSLNERTNFTRVKLATFHKYRCNEFLQIFVEMKE